MRNNQENDRLQKYDEQPVRDSLYRAPSCVSGQEYHGRNILFCNTFPVERRKAVKEGKNEEKNRKKIMIRSFFFSWAHMTKESPVSFSSSFLLISLSHDI